MMPPNLKNRQKILYQTFLFFFILVSIRLFYWQIIQGSTLRKIAESQLYRLEKIKPDIGKIFSSDQFPLVTNITQYQLSFYKPNIKDLPKTISLINTLIPNLSSKSRTLLINFQNNPSQKWITLPTSIDASLAGQLQNTGVLVEKIQSRFYPENSLALPILTRIEKYYQKQLFGRIGYSLLPKDALGQSLLTQKSWQIDPVSGQNLYLSINRQVQFLSEQILSIGLSKYSADSGSISIMDPKTGQIISMTSLVSTASASPSATPTSLSALTDLFEPGSIFKPLVVAMALDSNSINSDFICSECQKPLIIDDYTINNWNQEIHPNSSLRDIIKNSDNIGMSLIIDRLGLTKFLKYFKDLSLNQKTNIDLPGEAKPVLKEYWADIDLATASFGQGFSINQIQMLSAFNVLANDGLWVRPKIAIQTKPNEYMKSQIFKQTTVTSVNNILKYAVENGAISQLKPKNLEVCAKSGTAQVAVRGGYTNSQTTASYIGFSPCVNPKFTMIITINNPKSSPWGSSTAAPLWFELAEKITPLL
jgi:stage V sporulation protein D (sporulation-specific penicillin-binding protein)